MRPDFWDALREAEEDFLILSEDAGIMKAEYLSECGAYGDAWPGSAIALREAEERVAKARDYYEALCATLH